jgi:hypothetical protein
MGGWKAFQTNDAGFSMGAGVGPWEHWEAFDGGGVLCLRRSNKLYLIVRVLVR